MVKIKTEVGKITLFLYITLGANLVYSTLVLSSIATKYILYEEIFYYVLGILLSLIIWKFGSCEILKYDAASFYLCALIFAAWFKTPLANNLHGYDASWLGNSDLVYIRPAALVLLASIIMFASLVDKEDINWKLLVGQIVVSGLSLWTLANYDYEEYFAIFTLGCMICIACFVKRDREDKVLLIGLILVAHVALVWDAIFSTIRWDGFGKNDWTLEIWAECQEILSLFGNGYKIFSENTIENGWIYNLSLDQLVTQQFGVAGLVLLFIIMISLVWAIYRALALCILKKAVFSSIITIFILIQWVLLCSINVLQLLPVSNYFEIMTPFFSPRYLESTIYIIEILGILPLLLKHLAGDENG